MRTTLDIAPDVLAAAKEISLRSKQTTGEVVSHLVRIALTSSRPATKPRLHNGFEVIPAEGRVVTTELVRQIMEESETP
jgi:hypothetical protein